MAEGDPDCSVLLTAFGTGAQVLEQDCIMRGARWSVARAAAAPDGRLAAPDAYQEADVSGSWVLSACSCSLRRQLLYAQAAAAKRRQLL